MKRQIARFRRARKYGASPLGALRCSILLHEWNVLAGYRGSDGAPDYCAPVPPTGCLRGCGAVYTEEWDQEVRNGDSVG